MWPKSFKILHYQFCEWSLRLLDPGVKKLFVKNIFQETNFAIKFILPKWNANKYNRTRTSLNDLWFEVELASSGQALRIHLQTLAGLQGGKNNLKSSHTITKEENTLRPHLSSACWQRLRSTCPKAIFFFHFNSFTSVTSIPSLSLPSPWECLRCPLALSVLKLTIDCWGGDEDGF